MSAALLVLLLAGAPTEVAVLEQANLELWRLRCYDAATAALEEAQVARADTKNRAVARRAGERWRAAYRRLLRCQRVDDIRPVR